MPSKKQLIAAGLLSASLVGGGAVGAILGTPSVTSAQEAEDEGTTDETPAAPDGPRGGRHGHLLVGLTAAAEALGLRAEELRTELADGSSIADVAAERDVDVQTVIDAVVAQATAEIDEKVAAGELDAARAEQIEANLDERVTAMVNGEGRGFGGPGRGFGGRHGRGPGLEAAADALGLTVTELRSELSDGSSIADVAGERDVEVQTVIDAMVAEATARLDELKEDLPERITALVNGERPSMDDGAGD